MDGAQSGLRSGETGGPLREEGGPKQRSEEPLRLKMEMFICSHFTRGFPVLTMGTGHHCGDPSADTHQEPQDRRRDAKSLLLLAQHTSRATPGARPHTEPQTRWAVLPGSPGSGGEKLESSRVAGRAGDADGEVQRLAAHSRRKRGRESGVGFEPRMGLARQTVGPPGEERA